MISEPTLAQIANLQLRPTRPLVICDVDEVVVHFTRDFEDFLGGLGLWLDTSISLFSSNIRTQKTRILLSPEEIEKTVVQFFTERTLDMQTIEG
ncbi:MAG TPA: hypothetical protein VF224_12675, partial [Aestuariivirga sp.]